MKRGASCERMLLRFRPGQSVVEVALASALLLPIAMALIALVGGAYDTGTNAREATVATELATQGLEAARAIKDRDFALLTDGSHGVDDSGGFYVFAGASNDDLLGKYDRVVTVEPVTRDPGCGLSIISKLPLDHSIVPTAFALAACVGGGVIQPGTDPQLKKVTSRVDYVTADRNQPKHVTIVTLLSSWRTYVIPQCNDGSDNDGDGATDFSGGDFSCTDANDNDETNPKAQCQNGLDDDGDTLTDLDDLDCTSSQDNDEANP